MPEHFLQFQRILLLFALFGWTIGSTGCGDGEASDAYGNFESDEVTISAGAQGRLLRFDVDEGDVLDADAVVGLVDTTRLGLQRRALLSQRRSLLAQRQATLAQQPEVEARIAALRAQLETAEEELARTQRLYADQAATARELNGREGEVAVLRRQIEQAQAQRGSVREQAASVEAQAARLASEVAEVEARMRDARIVNPVAGTVLTVLAARGETVQPGAPLYTLADLDTLVLRAYADGAQLPRIRLGRTVEVLVDDGTGGLRALSGVVTFIAADAQFTPTPIQTRDERAELVYAFEVRVPNPDGLLKIGMPGEVRFTDGPDAEAP